MSEPSDRLSKEDLERVLREKVLPRARLDELTSHETPKAIVLAGQPGAGKGALVRAAREEFRGDILVIDPDEQRERIPGVRRLQEADPFGWPDQTNKDAFGLANGLRDEGVKRHVNLVIDGSMSDAGNSSRTIETLKKKGYEVEVRAISTHWLESEFGIDRRFTNQIDENGVARDVDMDFHNRVYNDLPGNLDKVAERTGVQVRIYDRELNELYDNRRDVGSPSEVLRETRTGRVEEPEVRQRMQEDWKRQQAWHEAMPETLRARQDVSPTTADTLIAGSAERGKLERAMARAEGIAAIEAPALASEPLLPRLGRAGATAGIAGLGVAAAAYDAKETGERINTALAQDNLSAARSEATHFTARGVGGAAAVFTPMAAGVSGGPAVALVVADAYLLTEAFDRGAKWLDKEQIVHQADREGVNWEFSGRQWIREDLKADLRDDGVDQVRGQSFSALPDKARELSYLASVEAVGQAIGKAGPRNPFELPANASDAPSNQPSPWHLDAQSGDWKRTRYEDIDPTDPRLPDRQVPETATPGRAAELNRQASQIIDENIARGPAALAAQYEIGHKRNGFDQFGEVPMSVQTALNPNTLEASDRKQYARDAQGQWSREGAPASPNHALELETTRERLLPALEKHRAQLAAMPEWRPRTPEQQDRANLRQLYADYGVNPNPDRFEAAYQAVKETREAQGINAAATSLALEHRPAGGYDINTPIQHLQIEGDGVVRVAATTTAADIQRTETALKGSPREIEAPNAQARDRQIQTEREANRAGVSQDEIQAAARTVLPMMSVPAARIEKSEEPDRAGLEESKQERPGAILLDNPTHQNHAMFAALLRTVHERDKERGREPDEFSRQLAGGLVEKARERGLETIGAAKFTPDGTKVGMTDTVDLSAPWAKTAVGDVGQLVGQKLSQSSENVAAINQQQALAQGLKLAQPAQSMDGPEVSTVKGARIV
jgi:hypothetical protein